MGLKSAFNFGMNPYAQSAGDSAGQLIAGVAGTIADKNAGIGGGNSGGGKITINGGAVTATGGTDGAGIGGGAGGSGDTITISGGTVTATGGDNGAGIGGGNGGAGGEIAVSGGEVTATGGDNGAGIGGGYNGAGGEITISGGAVMANGGNADAMGIGKGSGSASDGALKIGQDITVYSGDAVNQMAARVTNAESAITDVSGTENLRKRHMLTAYAPPVSYMDYDAETNELVAAAQPCADYTPVISATTAWGAAEAATPVWYVVSGNVTIGERITVTGDVRLILCDGAKLTASAGITVTGDNKLTIYGQSEGTGALIAGVTGTIAENNAGIGGAAVQDPETGAYSGGTGGTITINGGKITATGGTDSAGIGGGNGGNGGTITIHNGTVTATGGYIVDDYGEKFVHNNGGAGIGGGNGGTGGTITISGGTVTANSSYGSAGIGGGGGQYGVNDGKGGDGGTITISGGTVTANGSDCGAGIGGGIGAGGDGGDGGTITISGGTVTASSVRYAAGIGGGGSEGGKGGDGGTITISGGTVTATGGGAYSTAEYDSASGGAGIGGGNSTENGKGGGGGTVIISGGTVTAVSGTYNALGIGPASAFSGEDDAYGTLTIGSSVTLYGTTNKNDRLGETIVPQITGPLEIKRNNNTLEYVKRYVRTEYVPPVAYRDYDAATKTFSDAQCLDYTAVTDQKNWIAIGDTPVWYVVNGDVTIEDRVTVTGDVRLILCDGATLTASKGITVDENNSLTIYGQTNGTGALIAGVSGMIEDGKARIGGEASASGGTITINGGAVTATSGKNGAGIGSGEHSTNGGTITMNGGTVTATGSGNGAGIGGGMDSAGGTITVNGGTVTATSSENGAGIGSGMDGNDGAITISGGTVNATNQSGSVGISGDTLTLTWTEAVFETMGVTASSYSGNVTLQLPFAQRYMTTALTAADLTGGTVNGKEINPCEPVIPYLELDTETTAKECKNYTFVTPSTAAWGAADSTDETWYVVYSDVTIDERVTVTGNVHLILCDGATLNAGAGITVTGDNSLTIYAQSPGDSAGQLIAGSSDTIAVGNAGIGGDNAGHGGKIAVNGGRVTATGGQGGAGIGGGSVQDPDTGKYSGGEGGTITVNGGTVTATGGVSGAGIGGSNGGAGGEITISGGAVTANGGDYSAGIGGSYDPYSNGGDGGSGGKITISGGTVTATGGAAARAVPAARGSAAATMAQAAKLPSVAARSRRPAAPPLRESAAASANPAAKLPSAAVQSRRPAAPIARESAAATTARAARLKLLAAQSRRPAASTMDRVLGRAPILMRKAR